MTQPVKILLVDDEVTGREVLSLALQERGFHTSQADDGQIALEALESGTFDVVISDVLMPRMDGYRLCYEVRKSERWKGLPFIIYTGTYTAPEDERLGMKFGANKYLRKTGSVDEVVQAVEEVLNYNGKNPPPGQLDELDVMKVYSERLVKKLEEKIIELENAHARLLHSNRELTKLTEELKNSEARLKAVIDNEPECIKITSPDGILLDMNPAGLLMVEAESLEQVVGCNVFDLVHIDDRKRYVDFHESICEGESGILEFRIVGLRGTLRWTEAHAVPLRNNAGQVISVLSVARDITRRKGAEDALREAERKYRNIFENAIEGIFQSTPEGRYLSVNPSLARIFGYASPADMMSSIENIGTQVYVDPQRRLEFIRMINERGEIQGFEFEAYKKDRRRIWVSGNARAVRGPDGAVQYFEGTMEDVSEKRLSDQKFKELTQRIIETQELERKRISRELHDSVGQMLSSVKFRIQSAGEKIQSQKSKIWKDLSGAWTLLEQSIHEIRRIAHNLRPSVLDDLGLVSAVRSMCEEFEERTSITVNLRSSRFPNRLPPEVELSLFRIIQEVLNNVEQHSKATKLALQIQQKNSHLLVRIKDNGKGFDPLGVQKQRSRARGYGLDGIRERVATIGGHLELQTELKKGVEIQIKIPLEKQASP